MRILLTNDDGVLAPGLHALVKAFKDANEIYLACPDRERSGTGHSITVFEPIRIKEIELDGVEKAWVIGGTPVDCVKLAIARLAVEKFDLVISGINHGSNLGTDVLYSGTVAGAAEGVIMGVPSIAVSYNSFDRDTDFAFSIRFIKLLVDLLTELKPPANTLINVNIPDIKPKDIKGIRITCQGLRNYQNIFEERRDPRGNVYYWLGGGVIEEDNQPGSDVTAIKEGYISITPIRLDRTDYRLLKQYERILGEHPEIWKELSQ